MPEPKEDFSTVLSRVKDVLYDLEQKRLSMVQVRNLLDAPRTLQDAFQLQEDDEEETNSFEKLLADFAEQSGKLLIAGARLLNSS